MPIWLRNSCSRFYYSGIIAGWDNTDGTSYKRHSGSYYPYMHSTSTKIYLHETETNWSIFLLLWNSLGVLWRCWTLYKRYSRSDSGIELDVNTSKYILAVRPARVRFQVVVQILCAWRGCRKLRDHVENISSRLACHTYCRSMQTRLILSEKDNQQLASG